MTQVQQNLSREQKAILTASLICGGIIRQKSKETAQFIQTSVEHDWMNWKSKKLGSIVSSFVLDNSGNGCRLMTKSSSYLSPYQRFYSASSNQMNKRRIEGPLVSESCEHPLFLLTWFIEGKNWYFEKHDVHIPVLKDYSKTDIGRLCKGLRSIGFPSVVNSYKSNEIILKGATSKVLERLQKTIEDFDIDFLPALPTPDLRVKKELSPEQAAKLNQVLGMSFDDIAKQYGLSKATCWRRANKYEGSFDDAFTLEEAESVLLDYDVGGWKDLEPKEQEGFVKKVLDVLFLTPFPYPDPQGDKKLRTDYNKLSSKVMSLNSEKEIRPNSYYGLEICRPYFLNRYRASNSESSMSCQEAWFDPEQLKQAVTFQLKYGSPVTPLRVRRALQANLRTPTLFKPAQAKFICDTYGREGGWYWDPCAGYGGRLLGAMSSGMNYIGTDVDLETVEGNRSIYDDLQRLDLVPELEAVLVHKEAELFDPQQELDLVFTSPPYFDREQYSSSDGQSYLNYGESAESWAQGFLKPIFETAMTRLGEEGHLVINIADLNDGNKNKETVPLVQLTINCALDVGFIHENTLKIPLSNLSSRGYEPVLVFKK